MAEKNRQLSQGQQMMMFPSTGESTDLALLVDALAKEESSPWDGERIRDALVIEAGVEPMIAAEIASVRS